MDFKFRLVVVLLSLCLIVVVKGTDAPTEDYCRIDCGDYEINPFFYFCHHGVRVPCDDSHCRESRTEYSSKRCALYCGQVLQRLQQLPREIAARKVRQEEAASKQQRLNEQDDVVKRLQSEKSKLLAHTNIQNIKLNKTITAQQETIDNLQYQVRVFKPCLIIACVLLAILVIILIFFMIRYKPCFKRKRKDSCEEMKELLKDKVTGKPAGTWSTTMAESRADSAFESTCSGSTQPTEDHKHKCDDFNKFKPTDTDEKATVVTNGTKLPDNTSKDVVEESS